MAGGPLRGQDQGVAPQMGDLVNSQASLDTSSARVGGDAGPTPSAIGLSRSALAVERPAPRLRPATLAQRGHVPDRPASAARRRLAPPVDAAAPAQRRLDARPPLMDRPHPNGPSASSPAPRAVLVEALFALLSLPVVFAASVAVSAIAANLLAGVESPTFPWASRAVAFNRAEWLAFIAMAVTLGPVAEETFYRGFLYNALRQRLHPIPAALIQAVVFGYVHPFGLANSVGIGVAAVALAVVYEWRKTLLTPILVHAAMNAVGMVLLSGVLAAEADAPRMGVLGEARQGGCLVTEVVPGGAAETAGIRVGDLITTVDGEPVADIPNIARLVRAHQVGDTVSVEFLREGTAHRADVVLARLRE